MLIDEKEEISITKIRKDKRAAQALAPRDHEKDQGKFRVFVIAFVLLVIRKAHVLMFAGLRKSVLKSAKTRS